MVGTTEPFSTKKKIIFTISGLTMLLAVIYIILYHETAFQNIIEVTYPDGCIEKYINTVLSSPNCTFGRMMVETSQKKWPEMNFSLKNLSID